MNSYRRTGFILVVTLLLVGILYLGLRKIDSGENGSAIESIDKEGMDTMQGSESAQNETGFPEINTNSDYANYTWENVDGKASIEQFSVKDGSLRIELKNQTENNTLLFAHLEYIRMENEEEISAITLYFDGPKLEAGESGTLDYKPLKPLGKTGYIKIKELSFENDKDNYRCE